MHKEPSCLKVLKFGGTSMGSAKSLKKVAHIIENANSSKEIVWVVVSAMAGVTDTLLDAGRMAAAADKAYLYKLEAIEEQHSSTLRTLCGTEHEGEQMIQRYIKLLRELLHGVYLLREVTSRSLDLISSFGERFSARILTLYLIQQGNQTRYLNARRLLRTHDQFGTTQVNTVQTYKNLRRYYRKHKDLHIITGYISSSREGVTTTLGRGGSDYTATLIAAALDAKEVEIWTDVDGIMTANPRVVPQAYALSELSYEEVMEMSHFGAQVLYPLSLYPIVKKQIPLRIKNTFSPNFEGTYVSAHSAKTSYLIRNLSSISSVSLIEILSSVAIEFSDLSARILGVLARYHLSVILVSRASANHAISLVLHTKDTEQAITKISEAFSHEIQNIKVEHGYGVIAAIGKNMFSVPGVAAYVFTALVRRNINVKMVVQGASNMSISVVVKKTLLKRSLNALHAALFFPEYKEVSVFLIGKGLIGTELLMQMMRTQPSLQKERGIRLVLRGIANSRKMYMQESGIPLTESLKSFDTLGKTYELSSFIKSMKAMHAPNSLLIDCTSSEQVADSYTEVLEASISVITSNKRAFSGSMTSYRRLQTTSLAYQTRCFYETTVGAGLPVLSTLRDLCLSGDKILKIEGVLSGTMSYALNRFNRGEVFSQLVQEAQARGLTEPDPREDFKGMDVARKLLILAREAGYNLEMEDIHLQPFLPTELFTKGTVKAFYKALQDYDSVLEKQRQDAQAQGAHLCFLATFEPPREATIALSSVQPAHPCYALSGEDNIVALTTERYKNRPLMVRGPGAGASVTAAGVLADIIKASEMISTQPHPFKNKHHSTW